MKKLREIEDYWNQRARGFSLSVVEELEDDKKDQWLQLFKKYGMTERKLKVLDVGTGSGFFAVLLAQEGHDVTGIDYTPNMLKHAEETARKFNVKLDLRQMDAQNLEFEDESFDLIVTRNLMWNLEFPEKAYREWIRVLKKGGKIINFDGNYYLHLHDDVYKEGYEKIEYVPDRQGHTKNNIDNVDFSIMREIARELPMSSIRRPQWDVNTLVAMGVNSVSVDLSQGRKFAAMDQENNEIYLTSAFMICAEK
ncbi:Methyltransferase type 11 [Alkaliphilus metalliredigens QYMF]|uniref:Methyltransferase type 11 n=1 Tax=Alkaliphilus metalliredigens (strain QYMF) TaxID=293826 RepID=A6TPQ5_ALKMQ|nr:class I SAM-dependent methyltransferase [Alkaliphilus metalliredigens]ABR48173.1 Methyltransferase type 11 [Alkaliphilus metalliredigens QYMF]